MKPVPFILLMLFALLKLHPADAIAGGFYKWVDENGQVHYSDKKSDNSAAGKKAEQKDFDDVGYNVTPPVVWPATDFSSSDRRKSKRRGAKSNAGPLPWFTRSNFKQEVLKSNKLTLVEFWASWCGICLKVDPVINDLARKYRSKVKIGRVDIDKQKILQNRYKVSGVPNLLFFKRGKVVGRLVGGYSRESYVRMIESNL